MTASSLEGALLECRPRDLPLLPKRGHREEFAETWEDYWIRETRYTPHPPRGRTTSISSKLDVVHILRGHVHDCDTLPKRKARAD
jgi:hypothetical protein